MYTGVIMDASIWPTDCRTGGRDLLSKARKDPRSPRLANGFEILISLKDHRASSSRPGSYHQQRMQGLVVSLPRLVRSSEGPTK